MKYAFFILILSFPFFAIAQQQTPAQKRYYFMTNSFSTLGGVRDGNGKSIIPPHYWITGHEHNDLVTENEIVLMDTAAIAHHKDSLNFSDAYVLFDRNGNFLYHPFWFDNGADYYSEGLRRFTENSRMGFVNRLGEKVIPATFAFAYPFESGISVVCYDCRYIVYRPNDEHGGGYGGGNHWAIIDRKGTVLKEGDSSIPARFSYQNTDSLAKAVQVRQPLTATEQKLVTRLQQLPEVKELYHQTEHINGVETKAEIRTEVYELPSAKSPFYCIQFLEKYGMDIDDYIFLVSPDGKTIFHVDHMGNILSLAAWSKERKK